MFCYRQDPRASFTYDSLSRRITHTDGKGQVTRYTYDGHDRLTRVTFDGDTSCSSRATCVDYGYDSNDNLISRIDATATTTFTYDKLNRVTAKTLPAGRNACSSGGSAMTYTYEDTGNLLTHCSV